MIVEIQVLPSPSGTAEDHYAHVDAALEVIKRSGVIHEVGPLGTWLEGPADELWPLVRAAHDATLRAGATSVVSVVKIAEAADDAALRAASLIGPHR